MSFKVGDIVHSKNNTSYEYEVLEIWGSYCSVKLFPSGEIDGMSTFTTDIDIYEEYTQEVNIGNLVLDKIYGIEKSPLFIITDTNGNECSMKLYPPENYGREWNNVDNSILKIIGEIYND